MEEVPISEVDTVGVILRARLVLAAVMLGTRGSDGPPTLLWVGSRGRVLSVPPAPEVYICKLGLFLGKLPPA